MIQQITDKEELEHRLYLSQESTAKNKEYWITATLTNEIIEQWKANGNFRHIKHQLQAIDGIKFACTTFEGGCEYIFLLPSKQLKNRLYFLLYALYYGNNRLQLVKCSTIHETDVRSYAHIEGEVNACPLF